MHISRHGHTVAVSLGDKCPFVHVSAHGFTADIVDGGRSGGAPGGCWRGGAGGRGVRGAGTRLVALAAQACVVTGTSADSAESTFGAGWFTRPVRRNIPCSRPAACCTHRVSRWPRHVHRIGLWSQSHGARHSVNPGSISEIVVSQRCRVISHQSRTGFASLLPISGQGQHCLDPLRFRPQHHCALDPAGRGGRPVACFLRRQP